MVNYGMVYGMVWYGVAWHGMVLWHGIMAWHGIKYDIAWYVMVNYGMVRYA